MTEPVASSFLACLAAARHETWPFDYWLLQDALPREDCEEIADLPFAPPENPVFDGKRESNNAARVYFSPENQERFPVCRRIADGFRDRTVLSAIEQVTGTDLSDAHLRIEYCQDSGGFWLEPHTDILVKKFTMLVYLSEDPALAHSGTDIFQGPPDFEYVGSAPCGMNKGLIFIPGDNTWHGAGHNPIQGVRKSIIVNYVASEWREVSELA